MTFFKLYTSLIVLLSIHLSFQCSTGPSEGCVWLYRNYITKVEVCSDVPDLSLSPYNFDNATVSVYPGPKTSVKLWEGYNYTGAFKFREDNEKSKLIDFPCSVSSVQIISTRGNEVRGYIKNAQTNKVFNSTEIANAKVVFQRGLSGRNYTATIHPENSTYTAQLHADTYQRLAILDNYVISKTSLTVSGPSDESNVANTIYLSAIFKGWRVVLTWDPSKEKDLDSYTLLPDGTKVYYSQRFSCDRTIILDTDNRDGTGAETTSFGNFTSETKGPIRYFVNSYTRVSPVAKSGAVVTVYHGDSEVNRFEAPNNNAEGYWWEVFRLDLNGSEEILVPLNEIKTSMPEN